MPPPEVSVEVLVLGKHAFSRAGNARNKRSCVPCIMLKVELIALERTDQVYIGGGYGMGIGILLMVSTSYPEVNHMYFGHT